MNILPVTCVLLLVWSIYEQVRITRSPCRVQMEYFLPERIPVSPDGLKKQQEKKGNIY